jgi:hypothetical protein
MKLIWIILFGLFFYIDCKPCDCGVVKRDSSVTVELRYSDIAFYGELMTIDSIKKTYRFKILELFKGNYSGNIINGCIISSCSVIPFEKGLWIIYAKKVNDSTISISMCSPSIPLRKAEGLVPPPPLFYDNGDKAIDALKVKIHILEKRTEGLSYWFSDLEKLRKYKSEHIVVKTESFDFKSILILSLLLINIILIIVVLKLMKK